MAVHWQIEFTSLKANETYTVSVYDENYNGSPVRLLGGAVPFETEEDTDDDMFIPIRKQTGYLRIFDNGTDLDGNTFDWREFIPTTDTDRPVRVTDGSNNVVWMGFIQAQNFGFELYGNPQERAFPLQCPLSVLSTRQFPIENREIKNFAYLLYDCHLSIPDICRPNVYYIQGGEDARRWLLKKIDWHLFSEMDDNETLKGKYTCYECLEEMCKYWGWTARMYGEDLYLMCADDANELNALRLNSNGLMRMAGLESTSEGSVEQMFWRIAINDNFASRDNEDYQMRGPNKAVVTADCGEADEKIFEAFPVFFAKEMHNKGIGDDYGDYEYSKDTFSFATQKQKADCVTDSSFNVLYIGNDLEYLLRVKPWKAVIRIKSAYDSSTFVKWESVGWHDFYDGVISMNCEIYRNGEKFEDKQQFEPYVGNKTMYMRLGIGTTRSNALWWNGETWSANLSTFYARIGGGNDTLYFCKDKSLKDTPLIKTHDEGLWPITNPQSPQYGKIFVDFLGSDDIGDAGNRAFDIDNFRLKFKRKDITNFFDLEKPERNSEKEYTESSTNIIASEWSADTIFATENSMNFGYGVVLNEDYSYYKGEDSEYFSYKRPPEFNLALRVIDYWRTSKRKIVAELFTHDGTSATAAADISPRTIATIDGTKCYPTSIGRNWRDDIVKVTFMEDTI